MVKEYEMTYGELKVALNNMSEEDLDKVVYFDDSANETIHKVRGIEVIEENTYRFPDDEGVPFDSLRTDDFLVAGDICLCC